MSSYATVEIASEPLEDGGVPCRNFILDGQNLLADHIGVNRFAASGAVFTQTLAVAVGAKFGIKSSFLPASVLSDVIDAINSAMSSTGSFPVVATDEMQSISVNCVPDYEAGLVSYPGEQRMDSRAIKDVVFRFVVVS
jgi:hypothetical protein